MALPVVFQTTSDISGLVRDLNDGYTEAMGESPSIQQVSAWRGSLAAIKKPVSGFPIIAEFPIFDLERADFVVVGKQRALVIETKGWRTVSRVNDYSVMSDGRLEQDPCYQLNNYVSKLRFFHSSSSRFSFDGALFTYHTSTYKDSCSVILSPEQLGATVSTLGDPGDAEDVSVIVNGKFVITKSLIDLIKENKEALLDRAARVLLAKGYGLTSEQMSVVEAALLSVEKGEKKTYLVKGGSGTGKTLVALTLLLEAVGRGHKALLGYRNNRLLNTLRDTLNVNRGQVNLSSLIQFYSTGPVGRFRGIGEPNFPIEKYDPLDLVIFDEAQRMTESVVQTSMTRAPVSVYFYDESQILIGNEQGRRENYLKFAPNATESYLSAPFRAPKAYLDFVVGLFEGEGQLPGKYEFEVFEDIEGMVAELQSKKNGGARVALVSAFTESDGDRDPKSSKNVRIGYPLQSGFELYKGSGVEVRWLMDEKKQYPRYWMGLMDPLKYCASVYGAQGFEADYVGVIWGRDFVRQAARWRVNPGVITDRVGSNYSVRKIAERDQKEAEKLLRNRYYVMLTRGIKGTFVVFEDEGTRDFVEKSIRS